jgi:phospholipid-translocating ATPase
MLFKKLFISQACKYEADDTSILAKIIKSGIKPYQNLEPGKKAARGNESITVDAVLALMICHNVTPVLEDDGSRVLQGSSPDELTLVKFGEELGFSLRDRTEDFMEIVSSKGEVYQFDILIIFPFTSESKRMGIIVRERQSQKLLVYVKGADVVM